MIPSVILAAKNGQVNKLRHLIFQNPSDTNLSTNGLTPLFAATLNGNIDCARFLLKHNANPFPQAPIDQIPFIVAIKTRNFILFKDFLDFYSQNQNPPNSILLENRYLIHYIAQLGTDDMIAHCIKLKFDINIQDLERNTPLHWSVKAKNFRTFLSLMEQTDVINVNLKNNLSQTPLHLAAESGMFQFVKDLIQSGADPLCTTQNGDTVLHYAAAAENIVSLSFLVKTVPHLLNKKNNSGQTPIHLAALCGDADSFTYLLHSGALINILDNSELSCIHLAKEELQIRIIQTFHNTPPVSFSQFLSPSFYLHLFHYCVKSNHLKSTKYLISMYNHFVNALDSSGDTPLIIAIKSGHTQMVKLLLDFKASPQIPNKQSLTPLFCGILAKQYETIRLIISRYPDCALQTCGSISPLQLVNKITFNCSKDLLHMTWLLKKHKNQQNSSSADSILCETCNAAVSSPLLCSKCFQSFYCSTQCQENDWQRHESLCCKVPHPSIFVKPKML